MAEEAAKPRRTLCTVVVAAGTLPPHHCVQEGSTNIDADALSHAPLGVDHMQIKEVAVAGSVQTTSNSTQGTISTRDEF